MSSIVFGKTTRIVCVNTMKHPAAKGNYEELEAKLLMLSYLGYIKCVEHNGLCMFTYTQKTVNDKAWSVYTLVSRGLIVDRKAKKIVAYTMPKFFNYGEDDGSEAFGGMPFTISEKMDGSMGTVFQNQIGQWQVATKGSFTSDQAKWGTKFLYEEGLHEKLEDGHTYIVELIYPENRIVVNYGAMLGMVLLTSYGPDGEEYPDVSIEGFFQLPDHTKSYVSERDIIDKCKTLDKDTEGFVVRYTNGTRVKFKGDEYCRIHHVLSHVTPLGIWNMLREDDNIKTTRDQLPEEYQKDFDAITELIWDQYDDVIRNINGLVGLTQNMTDKEVGLQFKKWTLQKSNANKEYFPFVFAVRKHEFYQQITIPCRARDKLFNLFRPGNNVLPGYSPSVIMNRFTPKEATV